MLRLLTFATVFGTLAGMRVLLLLALIGSLLISPVHAAGETFTGKALAGVSGAKVGGFFVLRADERRLSGSLFLSGLSHRLVATGSVQETGHFRLHVTGRNGITGMLSGKISSHLRGRGSLRIPGLGRTRIVLDSRPSQKAPPGFEGTFTAVAPLTATKFQKISKVTVVVKKASAQPERYTCTVVFPVAPIPISYDVFGIITNARPDKLIISSANATPRSAFDFYLTLVRADVASTTYFDLTGSYNATTSAGLNYGTFEGYETR
jgi:hypothetical protein